MNYQPKTSFRVFMGEIPEYHHTFVLFDAPQNWQFNDLLVFQDAEIGMLE